MNATDYKFVAQVLADLFPQYKPNDEEAKLWRSSLIAFDRAEATGAIRKHRTSHSWPTPDMSKVLELCRVHAVDSEVEDSDMSARYAEHAQRARQDMEASLAFIRNTDQAIVERAKKWLAEDAVPGPGKDEVAACGIKHNLLGTLLRQPNVATYLLVDAIAIRPWERGEGIEAIIAANA